MDSYVPAKAGKSGREVHAARKFGNTLRTMCNVTNTHSINRHPTVMQLPANTKITCKKCLARIAEEANSSDGLRQFSERLYASLFGEDQ